MENPKDSGMNQNKICTEILTTPSNSWTEILAAASGDIRRMSYTDRYTTVPILIRENVAEHSYWVSLFSMMIHRHLDSMTGSENGMLASILSFALIHDTVECASGDLVRTFKYMTPELKAAVDIAEDKIKDKLPLSIQDLFEIPAVYLPSDGNMEYVKSVVKLADFMSLFTYMNREVLRGNQEIHPFVRRMEVDLKAEYQKALINKNERISLMSGMYMLMADNAFTFFPARII